MRFEIFTAVMVLRLWLSGMWLCETGTGVLLWWLKGQVLSFHVQPIFLNESYPYNVEMKAISGSSMFLPVYQTLWCHIPVDHNPYAQCHEHLGTYTVNNTSQDSCFCIAFISNEVVMRPHGEFCVSLDTWTTWRCLKNTYDHCKCIINLWWHFW